MYNEKEYNRKYRLAHLEKEKESGKKYRFLYPERYKKYNKEYYLENSKKIKERARKWNAENKERVKSRMGEYYGKNKTAIKQKTKKYQEEHVPQVRKWSREWAAKDRIKNPEKQSIQNRKFRQTPKGIISRRKEARKAKARRRQLGFIPLNKPFPGSDAHHTGKEIVIYIPAKLHQSVRHSVLRNQNMDKINKLAWDFLIYKPKEPEK